MLQHKVIALDGTAALKALTEGTGQLIGYASVFNGLDAYGDTIAPGAYRDTIPQFIQRGTLHSEHDSRIRLGTITDAKEDDHGLLVVADFHSDPEAQRIRTQIVERMERGKFVGLSIGYQAEDYEMRDARDGEMLPPFASKVRVLNRIHLYEISEVTVPADSSAEVIAAKSAIAKPFEAHFEDVRVAVRDWAERIRTGSDLRTRDGKAVALPDARKAALVAVSGSLRQTADELDALLVPPPPADRINVGLELRRRQLERRGILERPAS